MEAKVFWMTARVTFWVKRGGFAALIRWPTANLMGSDRLILRCVEHVCPSWQMGGSAAGVTPVVCYGDTHIDCMKMHLLCERWVWCFKFTPAF